MIFPSFGWVNDLLGIAVLVLFALFATGCVTLSLSTDGERFSGSVGFTPK